MNSEISKMPCVLCGNLSTLMCQRCGEPYCNYVCQREDWQRHKYFCIIMPPLVSLKPMKPGATNGYDEAKPLGVANSNFNSMESILKDSSINESNNNNICSIERLPVTEKPVKLSSTWREHVNPPENEFFDCRVTYLEKDGSFWVVEESNTERLERLTENIARSMQNKKPCSIQELTIGDLVSVAFDKKIYRGEVMELKVNSNCAELRLIDYGAVAIIDVRAIYLAVPRMADFKAYAFRVMMSSNAGVEITKTLSLRLLGSKTPEGAYPVQLKRKNTIPLELPKHMLTSKMDFNLVKIFPCNASLNEPQVALMQIKEPSTFYDELNSSLYNKSGSNFTEPFPEKLGTFFLAASTKQGYRRAFLLDFIEQTSKFLVYEMDEGRISIADEVRRIPMEFLDHPLRVIAVTVTDGNMSSLQQTLSKSDRDLSIKFEAECWQEKNIDKLRTAEASLMVRNEQVCSVRVNTFMGRIAELGLKYWEEPIENGSVVYITHIESYHTICISSVHSKQYTDIFKSLNLKCLPFSRASDIAIGSIVLVVCPNRGYYRAEVVAERENDQFAVRNIDIGITHKVPASYLRKPCRFLENLPVSQCRASIKTICSIPSDVVPTNTTALRLLRKLYEQKSELQVVFTDSECNSLDLLDPTVEPPSLVARMLPMMFTASAVELQPSQDLPASPVIVQEDIQSKQFEKLKISGLPPLPPSPPNTPILDTKSSKHIKRHYLDSLKLDLLPLVDNVQILVLNAIGVHKTGIVTACFFSSEKVAENFQNLLNLVSDIGKDDKVLPGYLPDVGEMCLTLFAEDNTWYRGVCLRVRGHDVEILYCDFGNSEVVPLDRIKPIPSELLQTVYATKCFIDGFDKSKDFMVLEEYLAVNNKIECTVLDGPEANTRLIKLPILDQILSKQQI